MAGNWTKFAWENDLKRYQEMLSDIEQVKKDLGSMVEKYAMLLNRVELEQGMAQRIKQGLAGALGDYSIAFLQARDLVNAYKGHSRMSSEKQIEEECRKSMTSIKGDKVDSFTKRRMAMMTDRSTESSSEMYKEITEGQAIENISKK